MSQIEAKTRPKFSDKECRLVRDILRHVLTYRLRHYVWPPWAFVIGMLIGAENTVTRIRHLVGIQDDGRSGFGLWWRRILFRSI